MGGIHSMYTLEKKYSVVFIAYMRHVHNFFVVLFFLLAFFAKTNPKFSKRYFSHTNIDWWWCVVLFSLQIGDSTLRISAILTTAPYPTLLPQFHFSAGFFKNLAV